MALTKVCVATSLLPQTTKPLPFALFSSVANKVMAVAAFLLLPSEAPDSVEPVTALYNAIRAGPCSDGLIGIRVSALEPVKLMPLSN